MDLSEIVKVLIGPVATVLLAWAVGNRLSARWAMRQKRREETRAAANEFYRLYGEFFAVWKLWNYFLDTTDFRDNDPQRWELLKRAAAAEAGVEALLVKLTSERTLKDAETETLGRFRQGFQALRQAIRDRRKLDWRSSDDREYAAFKRLASQTGRLVSSVDQSGTPTTAESMRALLAVTSNVWEGRWPDFNDRPRA